MNFNNGQNMDCTYCKLTNESEYENGILLKTGLNIANVTGLTLTSQNGFRFTTNDNMFIQVNRLISSTKYDNVFETMQYMRYVTFLSTSKILKDGNIFITDQFILSDRIHIWSNSEICIKLLDNDGTLLKHVNDDIKTVELCKHAYVNNYQAIKYFPLRIFTDDLCLFCIKTNYKCFSLFDQTLKTKYICEVAVCQFGENLEFVPDHLKNKKICLLALKQNNSAKKHLPHRFRTLGDKN